MASHSASSSRSVSAPAAASEWSTPAAWLQLMAATVPVSPVRFGFPVSPVRSGFPFSRFFRFPGFLPVISALSGSPETVPGFPRFHFRSFPVVSGFPASFPVIPVSPVRSGFPCSAMPAAYSTRVVSSAAGGTRALRIPNAERRGRLNPEQGSGSIRVHDLRHLHPEPESRCRPSTCNVGKPLEKPWENLGKPGKTLENLGIARRSRAPEISETLGIPWKTMEKRWNGFWEHSGRGQAAGRPGADKGKCKGNTMVGKPWKPLGKTLENLWKSWGILGKPWGTLEEPWKNLGRPWNRPAADFWMTAAGALAPPATAAWRRRAASRARGRAAARGRGAATVCLQQCVAGRGGTDTRGQQAGWCAAAWVVGRQLHACDMRARCAAGWTVGRPQP
eukprot:gene10335-biopygen6783